jgi:hypothetical protein
VRIHLAIDDADSLAGGCTTRIAVDLVGMLDSKGAPFLDYPNLIRLSILWLAFLCFSAGTTCHKHVRSLGTTARSDRPCGLHQYIGRGCQETSLMGQDPQRSLAQAQDPILTGPCRSPQDAGSYRLLSGASRVKCTSQRFMSSATCQP